MAVCLLSAVRKQQRKQYNYHVDQSELLTRFWTDFTSSLWNFCRWGAGVSHGETSLAARTEARRLFSRAKYCAVADPDLQIREPWSSRPWDKGGGGGLKKNFSALRASVWCKHRGGGAASPGPSPRSATDCVLFLIYSGYVQEVDPWNIFAALGKLLRQRQSQPSNRADGWTSGDNVAVIGTITVNLRYQSDSGETKLSVCIVCNSLEWLLVKVESQYSNRFYWKAQNLSGQTSFGLRV